MSKLPPHTVSSICEVILIRINQNKRNMKQASLACLFMGLQNPPDLTYMQIFMQRKDFRPVNAGAIWSPGLSWLASEVLKAVHSPLGHQNFQEFQEGSLSSLSCTAPSWLISSRSLSPVLRIFEVGQPSIVFVSSRDHSQWFLKEKGPIYLTLGSL